LADALAQFPEPDPDQLDVLTLIDMSTSPAGKRVAVSERLDEILDRYPPADPVHRARGTPFAIQGRGPRGCGRVPIGGSWDER
jgi:hypothetical protein